jgi:hypothetical protein
MREVIGDRCETLIFKKAARRFKVFPVPIMKGLGVGPGLLMDC